MENRIRKFAQRRGYRVRKARGQQHSNNLGQFQLVDAYTNTVVAGERYDWSLQEIEAWLKSRA